MRSLKPWHLVAVGPLVGLGWGIWGLGSAEDRVTFMAVGQGDCTVFESGGTTMLIDTGPKDEFTDAGERIVVPKLLGMGIQHVNLILLTHPDADHIGGTGAVLKAFPGARVAISSQFRSFPTLVTWQKAWHLSDQDVIWLPPKGEMRVGGWKFAFVCPVLRGTETNSGSVLTHAALGEASVTASGDAPSDVEAQMVPLGDWKAAILKLGHHGSASSSGETWLAAVHPRWAVASAGRDNRFGHPSKSVVDRCNRAGIELLRTDQIGDIQFRVSQGKLTRIR